MGEGESDGCEEVLWVHGWGGEEVGGGWDSDELGAGGGEGGFVEGVVWGGDSWDVGGWNMTSIRNTIFEILKGSACGDPDRNWGQNGMSYNPLTLRQAKLSGAELL